MKDMLKFNNEDRIQLQNHIQDGSILNYREVSLNEIKELVGCQVYEFYNMATIEDIGKVERVDGSNKNSIHINTTKGYGNHFVNLRYYKEYNIYADYPYSRFMFSSDNKGSFCRSCIHTCYDKEVTECDFFEE